MRAWFCAAVLVVASLSGCSQAQKQETTGGHPSAQKVVRVDKRPALLAKAKYRVTRDFFDPAAAQFREIAYYNLDTNPTVCGEVNGKNLAGAYSGFHRFYYGEKDNDAAIAQASDDQVFKVVDDVSCREFPKGAPTTDTTTTVTQSGVSG